MNLEEEEIKLFIKKDPDYYWERFESLKDGKKVSMNFFALFGGVIWIFYRKMYLTGFLILAFFLLEWYLEDLLMNAWQIPYETAKLFRFYFPLAFGFILGVYGDYLYKKFVFKRVKKIKEKSGHTSEEFHRKLQKAGGVTYLPIVIVVILFGISLALSIEQKTKFDSLERQLDSLNTEALSKNEMILSSDHDEEIIQSATHLLTILDTIKNKILHSENYRADTTICLTYENNLRSWGKLAREKYNLSKDSLTPFYSCSAPLNEELPLVFKFAMLSDERTRIIKTTNKLIKQRLKNEE